jgi:hypothetical protein
MCFGGKTAWARVRPTLTGLFQIMPRACKNPGFVIMTLMIRHSPMERDFPRINKSGQINS